MGITATAAAKQNKLKRNAKWRANRRTTSDAFLEAEQKSRDRYNEFTKLSRMFVKAYPQEFAKWMREGRQVTRQPFGLPRHIPAPPAPTMAAPPVQLPDFRSVSSGHVPSARHMENSRMPASADTLAALGIRLD